MRLYEEVGKDRYGRRIGKAFVSDKECLGARGPIVAMHSGLVSIIGLSEGDADLGGRWVFGEINPCFLDDEP